MVDQNKFINCLIIYKLNLIDLINTSGITMPVLPLV